MKFRNRAHQILLTVLFLWLVVLGEMTQEAICVVDDERPVVEKVSTGMAWMDEVGDQFQKFLVDKIFGQPNVGTAKSNTRFLSHLDRGSQNQEVAGGRDNEIPSDSPFLTFLGAPGENPFRAIMERILDVGKSKDNPAAEHTSPRKQELVFSLLQSVQHLDDNDHFPSSPDFLKIIKDALGSALDQLKAAFGDILDDVDPSIAFSIMYYLATEDARKNPSWKRREHRFYENVSKDMILEMHDALYLSQVAYMDSLDNIRQQLREFQNNEWELAYGTTDSLPNMPAHFLLLHKNLAPLSDARIRSVLPWEGQRQSELTAVLVVRGTKEIADVLADATLKPVEYRDGYAHGGILETGKNLAGRYLPKLKALLQHSGRRKIRLFLVGHSLGAAAAAVAAMEFHEHDWIKVESIGFGCPSLLSPALSEGTKDYITTVVDDADIVPRMSGASVANLLLDLLEFDWTDMALEDIKFTMERATTSFPFGKLLPSKDLILDWAQSFIDRDIKPKLQKERKERLSNELIPPGSCIHLYRDGVGYSAVYTPCSFFSRIDLSRTLIDDHLVVPGYHRALVTIMRDYRNDYNVSSSFSGNLGQ